MTKITKKRAESQKNGQFPPNARLNGHARLKTGDLATLVLLTVTFSRKLIPIKPGELADVEGAKVGTWSLSSDRRTLCPRSPSSWLRSPHTEPVQKINCGKFGKVFKTFPDVTCHSAALPLAVDCCTWRLLTRSALLPTCSKQNSVNFNEPFPPKFTRMKGMLLSPLTLRICSLNSWVACKEQTEGNPINYFFYSSITSSLTYSVNCPVPSLRWQ